MNEQNAKFASMLGFARRSGKIVYGYDNLRYSRAIKLLAVSTTASDNLASDMRALSKKTGVPLVEVEELERLVGNNVKALGFTDKNMANAVAPRGESK